MTVSTRTIIAICAGVFLLAVGYGLCARPHRSRSSIELNIRHARDPQPPLTVGRPVLRAGCEASACHGAPATRALSDEPDANTWTSAASQWHARDPHTRATESLASPLARQIMAQLRVEHPDRWAENALDETRCLACHTNPSQADRPNRHDRERLRIEGVSCEACHGNASGWLFEHTNWTAAERHARYDVLGMTKLFDVGERAATCAGCHIGAPADPARGYPLRDMNHDMIAAGHPRLNFEFADYQRRLPPHWFEKDRTRDPCVQREAEFEAKAWLVGRVASAEATYRLLADRAVRAEREEADWPELSESKCFSCHRELLPREWRPNPSRARASTRQAIWPLTRVEHRPIVSRGASSGRVAVELAALETILARREPKPSETAQSAARVVHVLRELRSELTAVSDRAAAKTVLELYTLVKSDSLDWDESCQATQGLASLEWMRLRRASLNQQIVNPLFAEAYSGLTFPRPNGRDHFDSPRRFDPVGMRANLNRLLLSVSGSCAVP